MEKFNLSSLGLKRLTPWKVWLNFIKLQKTGNIISDQYWISSVCRWLERLLRYAMNPRLLFLGISKSIEKSFDSVKIMVDIGLISIQNRSSSKTGWCHLAGVITSILENVFEKLDWRKLGLKINEECLSHPVSQITSSL